MCVPFVKSLASSIVTGPTTSCGFGRDTERSTRPLIFSTASEPAAPSADGGRAEIMASNTFCVACVPKPSVMIGPSWTIPRAAGGMPDSVSSSKLYCRRYQPSSGVARQVFDWPIDLLNRFSGRLDKGSRHLGGDRVIVVIEQRQLELSRDRFIGGIDSPTFWWPMQVNTNLASVRCEYEESKRGQLCNIAHPSGAGFSPKERRWTWPPDRQERRPEHLPRCGRTRYTILAQGFSVRSTR